MKVVTKVNPYISIAITGLGDPHLLCGQSSTAVQLPRGGLAKDHGTRSKEINAYNFDADYAKDQTGI